MTADKAPPVAVIDVYSHHIRVRKFNHIVKSALATFTRQQAQWGLMRQPGATKPVRTIVRYFAAATADRSEFRFHVNQLEELIQHLRTYGLTQDQIAIRHKAMYTPERIEIVPHDGKQPREKQKPLIDYLMAPGTSKVLTAQTGLGKTRIGLWGIEHIGTRTAIIIKGMYIPKWIKDIEEAFETKKGDIVVVQGSKALITVMELALAGQLEAKFIIISIRTMAAYLEDYDLHKNHSTLYPVVPHKFFETLKVGIRLIDEVHMEFHANYRVDLYTHVPISISMSATLDSDDSFINRMYEVVWPRTTRAPEIEYDRFIAVKCLWYSLMNPGRVKCLTFFKQYNQTKFEQSILRDAGMTARYIDMIAGIVKQAYIQVREPGQKMMVFCGTVDMCTRVTKRLKELYPDLTINRYVAEDEYKQLLNADIVVSTVLSAGTAVDVPNLRVTLMTNALNSKQANIQVLGRTRRLKDWPDVTPEFYFLAARENDKHVQYAKDKELKLRGKVLSYNEMITPYRV